MIDDGQSINVIVKTPPLKMILNFLFFFSILLSFVVICLFYYCRFTTNAIWRCTHEMVTRINFTDITIVVDGKGDKRPRQTSTKRLTRKTSTKRKANAWNKPNSNYNLERIKKHSDFTKQNGDIPKRLQKKCHERLRRSTWTIAKWPTQC